jgi:acyl carrier protein
MTTLQVVQALLHANFDVAPELLRPEARLEDLAIDSLSVLELMFAVEDEFHVAVPSPAGTPDARIATVGELVAYIDRLVAEQRPALAAGVPQ